MFNMIFALMMAATSGGLFFSTEHKFISAYLLVCSFLIAIGYIDLGDEKEKGVK